MFFCTKYGGNFDESERAMIFLLPAGVSPYREECLIAAPRVKTGEKAKRVKLFPCEPLGQMEVWTGARVILSFGTAADRGRDWLHFAGVFAVGDESRYLEQVVGRGGSAALGGLEKEKLCRRGRESN